MPVEMMISLVYGRNPLDRHLELGGKPQHRVAFEEMRVTVEKKPKPQTLNIDSVSRLAASSLICL
jgi:hypothetical protein